MHCTFYGTMTKIAGIYRNYADGWPGGSAKLFSGVVLVTRRKTNHKNVQEKTKLPLNLDFDR
jgi:hypothetical protein